MANYYTVSLVFMRLHPYLCVDERLAHGEHELPQEPRKPLRGREKGPAM
jgi:hypothetical protein